jgi:hypothetical protein
MIDTTKYTRTMISMLKEGDRFTLFCGRKYQLIVKGYLCMGRNVDLRSEIRQFPPTAIVFVSDMVKIGG